MTLTTSQPSVGHPDTLSAFADALSAQGGQPVRPVADTPSATPDIPSPPDTGPTRPDADYPSAAADTPSAQSGQLVRPDPNAYAAEAISALESTGRPRPQVIRDLFDLRDFFKQVAGIVADEAAIQITEERQTGESFAALARRLAFLGEDRIADLVRRGEALLKAADTPSATHSPVADTPSAADGPEADTSSGITHVVADNLSGEG